MKHFLLLSLFSVAIFAETNTSDTLSSEVNRSKTDIEQKALEAQQVKEQMEREAHYAKTQSFAQGDDYDLKSVEVNQKSLENIPSIEPDYDFDMTDVYRDDI
jgi:hypothetical protein